MVERQDRLGPDPLALQILDDPLVQPLGELDVGEELGELPVRVISLP